MNIEHIVEFLIVIIATFVVSAVLLRVIIPILHAHKLGQTILDIGPIWHKKDKQGTPTMGGIGFIISMLLILLSVTVSSALRGTVDELAPMALTLSLGVANGMIGFFDDYQKLVKKQNEGLKWYQKIVLQTLVAVIYVGAMAWIGNMSTVLRIPFTNVAFDCGVLYYVGAVVFIVGIVNSVNLTDGLDGLASGIGSAVSMGLIVLPVLTVRHYMLFQPTAPRYSAVIAASLLGALLGFLVFNHYPAKSCHRF